MKKTRRTTDVLVADGWPAPRPTKTPLGGPFLSAVYAESVALLPARSDLVGGLPFASLLFLYIRIRPTLVFCFNSPFLAFRFLTFTFQLSTFLSPISFLFNNINNP